MPTVLVHDLRLTGPTPASLADYTVKWMKKHIYGLAKHIVCLFVHLPIIDYVPWL
jgi:hypothetical protein